MPIASRSVDVVQARSERPAERRSALRESGPTGCPTRAVCRASATAPGLQPLARGRGRIDAHLQRRNVGLRLRRRGRRRPAPAPSRPAPGWPAGAAAGRSSPKILTAMLARVPDSMWSMRCEIGWPIVTFVPGQQRHLLSQSPRAPLRAAGPVISSRTSISADSTPCTCSSSSALPVRRAVDVTSGTLSSSRSRALPSAFESARLVPGIVTALTVRAPSLNSGRNDRPAAAMPTSAATSSSDGRAEHGPPVRERLAEPALVRCLEPPRQRGSVPDAIRREFGSSHEHSTGVTVSATTSEADSATT